MQTRTPQAVPRPVRFALLACLSLGASAGCDGVASSVDERSSSARADGGAPSAGGPYFRPDIQQQLESSNCLGCHASGSTPMKAKKGPTTEAEWQQNFAEVRARAGQLAAKATGAEGHSALLKAEDAAAASWKTWAANGAPFAAGNAGGNPSLGSGVPSTVDAGTPLTWAADIGPLLAAKCTSCHGNSGSYSLTTLANAKGPGTDAVPNIVPGDASSLLVIYCRDGHQGVGAVDGLKVMRWVVDWGAAER